jgi:hypothetical protein
MSAARTATRSGSLATSSWTVTRPITVRPNSNGPCHWKWCP